MDGKYQKPHPDLNFDYLGYVKLSETRKKFEGWDFWFGRRFPTDILHEETEITYLANTRTYLFEHIKNVLLKNGFKIREI